MKARPDFFGDGAASHKLSPFDHEHATACTRQVGRGHQPIVARAGYDDVKTQPF
jgi:hypothetical protein